MTSDYRPRLSVDISERHNQLMLKYLDYGMRKRIFFAIIEDLFNLIEKHGAPKVIGAFTERAITLEEICKLKLGE